MLGEAVIAAFLTAALAGAVPLMLAAVGESIGEQAGVLNVGLEGVLLVGGYFGFLAAHTSGSFWLGFLSGALAGALLASLAALLSVLLGVNQIVVGVGLTLAGTGVSAMLYEHSFADSRPRLGVSGSLAVPWLSDLPVLGALFSQPLVFYIALCLPVLVGVWLRRSTPGLRLRAAGQNPSALDQAGGSVLRTRTLAVLFGGAMSGFGGAYLALVSAGTFTPGMSHGLGFLAIVVAMMGGGRMLWVVLLSLGYGALVAAGTTVQLAGAAFPNDAIAMLPFALVLLALVLLGGRFALPPALAAPYARGER